MKQKLNHEYTLLDERLRNTMIKLSPSILAADFEKLGEQIALIERSGAQYLHIDVMDGKFVPTISFGMPLIASIRKNSKLIFDVHLMVEEPIRFIEDFKVAGADIITVHAEACNNLEQTVKAIKNIGLKAGVSLNPDTPISEIEYILSEVDMILVMAVNPGYGGQAFIPTSLQKVSDLKEMINKAHLDVDIEVDGGVTHDNITEVLQSGANVVVAGTAIFRGNISGNMAVFQNKIKEFEAIRA